MENDDIIEIQMADGSIKKMKKNEAMKTFEDRMRGIKFEGNKMTKESEGKIKINELSKTDPEMSRFIGSCIILNRLYIKSIT
jgi:hypothetical protein